MEQDQDKRNEDAALGHDPFGDMTWEDETIFPVDEPVTTPEAVAPVDDLADDLDDLESMLFDDEPLADDSSTDSLSATELPVEETAVSPEAVTDDLFGELGDLESMLLGDAPDEPMDAPSITPPTPIAPPVADELKAAMLKAEDAMEEDVVAEETAVFDDATLELESELIADVDIDVLLQKIDNEIESINESVQHEDTVDLEEETAVFDEEEPEVEPQDSRYLDDLIANIDNQIDALYGTEDSIDVSGEKTHVPGQEEQHVIFHLANTEYTVPIGNVTEIGRPLPTTTVPNVPGWMFGVANLRGDIVSMVDLRGFLGLPPAHFEQDGRMIIAQSTDEEVTAGLLVDRVSGIRFLAVEEITAPTAAIEDQVAPYLRGVYEDNGRLLVVLNLDKLLLSSEMQQFESV